MILIGPHDSLCIQRSSAGDDQILVFIEKSDGNFFRKKDLVFWSMSGVGVFLGLFVRCWGIGWRARLVSGGIRGY